MKTTQEVDSFLNKMLIGTTATFLAGAAFLGANVERESVSQCPDELAGEGELAFCIDGVGSV